MSAVRKAFGSDRRLLQTVHGRGFRLIGDWATKPSATAAAVAEVKSARSGLSVARLPASESELVGRAAAAQELRDVLSAYRVVTLSGPGGIGKTKLALEVARDLASLFQGQAFFVELESIADPRLVPSAVASALGLKIGHEEVVPETVARALANEKCLLVLDNCEQVVDAAARLVETVVRKCPQVAFLSTSREILRVEGEYVFRVPPLDVPVPEGRDESHVLGCSAVQLLVARIKTRNPDFSPEGDDVPAMAAIVRRLDGIPLAIEFAAARAATLGIRQIVSLLDDLFGLFTGGRRAALARHHTLRAALDWSYALLENDEQRLLRHLAIFRGGFTLDAAAAVVSDADGAHQERWRIAHGISNLVSKSLVSFDGFALGRWRLLETIRAHAMEKLVEIGELGDVARRHAEFFRDQVASAKTGLQYEPTPEDVARYRREMDNVRAALDWAYSPFGDKRLGATLTAAYVPVWLLQSLIVECRGRIENAIDRLATDTQPNALLWIHLQVGYVFTLVQSMGPPEKIKQALIKALDVSDSFDDVGASLRILWAMWGMHLNLGECADALSVAERFSQMAHRTGDPTVVLVGDRLVGTSLQLSGVLDQAGNHLARVVERYPAKDHRQTVWFRYDQPLLARSMLTRVLWLRGLFDRAEAQASASLEAAQASGYKISLCWVLHYGICPLAFAVGDLRRAERGVGAFEEYAAGSGSAHWTVLASRQRGRLLVARGETAQGVELLQDVLDRCKTTGWRVEFPELSMDLADGLAALDRTDEALCTIERALAQIRAEGERWCLAELLRLKGELLLRKQSSGGTVAAAACFAQALDVARKQGAMFWELRAATSLARLRVVQDRPIAARQVLAPVYAKFTEGHTAADLLSASSILADLPTS
jgi:predicted ATPase